MSDVGTLKASIEHSPYRDLSHHIEKMIRYSRWGAEDLLQRGRRSNFTDMTIHPLWRFLREYIVYGGWRDGRAGLMVAALSSCSALLKYAYLQALNWQTAPKTAQAPRSLPPIAVEARQEAQLVSSES